MKTCFECKYAKETTYVGSFCYLNPPIRLGTPKTEYLANTKIEWIRPTISLNDPACRYFEELPDE